jgi:hypothetical protein
VSKKISKSPGSKPALSAEPAAPQKRKQSRVEKARRAYEGDDEFSLPPNAGAPKKPLELDAGPQVMGADQREEETSSGVLRFFHGLLDG